MNGLFKRGLLGVAGIAVMLVWWSIRPGDEKHTSAEGIPATVWNGGGGVLTIEAEASCPATLRVSFYDQNEDVSGARLIQTWERIPEGARRWSIQVPSRAGGVVELGADSPKPGDRLHWTLTVNGDVVDEQSQTLEEELDPGYAFFLQTGFDDYGAAQLSED